MSRKKDEQQLNASELAAEKALTADTTEPVDNDNTTVAQQTPVPKKEKQHDKTGDFADDDAAKTPQQAQTVQKTPAKTTNRKRWLPYVITAAALAVMVVLIGWAQGGFSDAAAQTIVGYWSDAFFVPGIICVCFGLLLLASNGGAFDMLSYAFKSLFRLFKKDVVDRKYGGYYEYSQARKAKKRSFAYMLIVGGAYTLVGIALLVVYSVCFD